MGSLRTKEGNRRYQDAIAGGLLEAGCPICKDVPLKRFKAWKIMKNAYPYDKIAVKHDILVPLRHVRSEEITQEEWLEFNEIKNAYVSENYEWLIESVARKRSIPDHYHMHLVTGTD